MTTCAPVRFCLFFTLTPCYKEVLSSFMLDHHFSMVIPGRKKYTAQYYFVWHYDSTKTSSTFRGSFRSDVDAPVALGKCCSTLLDPNSRRNVWQSFDKRSKSCYS